MYFSRSTLAAILVAITAQDASARPQAAGAANGLKPLPGLQTEAVSLRPLPAFDTGAQAVAAPAETPAAVVDAPVADAPAAQDTAALAAVTPAAAAGTLKPLPGLNSAVAGELKPLPGLAVVC